MSRGVTVLLSGSPRIGGAFHEDIGRVEVVFRNTVDTRRSITAAARGIGRHLGTCERSCSPVATVLAQSRRSTRPGDEQGGVAERRTVVG